MLNSYTFIVIISIQTDKQPERNIMHTLTTKTKVTEFETKYTRVSKNKTFHINIDGICVGEVKVINYTSNVLTVCEIWGIENDVVVDGNAVITFVFEANDIVIISAYTPSKVISCAELLYGMTYSLTVKDNEIVTMKVVEMSVLKEVDVQVNTRYIDDITNDIYTVILNDDKNAVLFNSENAKTIIVQNNAKDIESFNNNHTYIEY